MSAAIGAALKKIALAVVSDKKGRKIIIGIVLGLIVLVFTPIAVVLVMFSNIVEDTEHIPVSAEVEGYTELIEQYAEEHGVGEYTALIKAIMMQESGRWSGLDRKCPIRIPSVHPTLSAPRSPGHDYSYCRDHRSLACRYSWRGCRT